MSIFKAKYSIYEKLNEYVLLNNKYNADVTQRYNGEKLPLIVLSETINEVNSRTTDFKNVNRNVSYTINVFSKDTNGVSSLQINDELCELVIEVMENQFHLKGGVQSTIPRYDDQNLTHQKVLRYTGVYKHSIVNIK